MGARKIVPAVPPGTEPLGPRSEIAVGTVTGNEAGIVIGTATGIVIVAAAVAPPATGTRSEIVRNVRVAPVPRIPVVVER